jgi:hypothetical protein
MKERKTVSAKTSGLLLLVALTLSACGSYKPFDYVDTNNTIVGPGAFTGEDGEWVIYRKK